MLMLDLRVKFGVPNILGLGVGHSDKTYVYLCDAYGISFKLFSAFIGKSRASQMELRGLHFDPGRVWSYFPGESLSYVATSVSVIEKAVRRGGRRYDYALEIYNVRSTAAALRLFSIDQPNDVLKIEKDLDMLQIKLSHIHRTVNPVLL